jgi:tetratricopeptide (TPR) repeat protein
MIHAILALTLFAQTGSPPSFSAAAMEHVQAGVNAEKERHFETAIAEFRKVTELEPEQPAGYVRLGNAYMENRQYGEAIPALKRAIELAPDLPSAHQLLGYALLAQGYAADAIPHLEKVHEVGALGIAQIQTGHASEAVSNLQAALAATPGDPDILYYLSQASEMLSQQSIDTLLATHPNSERAYQLQGQAYFGSHKLAEAEKQYQLAVALRPDIPGLHLELGQVYAEGSQWAKAEEQFRAEVQLQPGSGEAAYRLGEALLQEGKFEEALAELERSDRLRPDMSETLYSLGKAASLAGNSSAAEQAWTRVIHLEKETPLAGQAHFALAALYRKQGKAQEAAQQMQEFDRLRKQSAK